MNEAACIADLSKYEQDRYDWLHEHCGVLDGFVSQHGQLVLEQAANHEALKAHLTIPGCIEALVLSAQNRNSLGQLLNEHTTDSVPVTESVINQAKAFVSQLYGVDLSGVCVIRCPSLRPTALGTVYGCGISKHVIVVPECSFEPYGVLVRQFGIAAHYTLMRGKPGLAAMMSNDLSQAMVGQHALLRYASRHPEQCSVIRHLQIMVVGEFAKGLSKSPEMPMGFIVSDLGADLMKAYGGGMFRAIMQELYESMSHGRAIYFGCSNFNGMALALALLDDDQGMVRFMQIDTGARKLADKLFEAFPTLDQGALAGFQQSFNERLAGIIEAIAPVEA